MAGLCSLTWSPLASADADRSATNLGGLRVAQAVRLFVTIDPGKGEVWNAVDLNGSIEGVVLHHDRPALLTNFRKDRAVAVRLREGQLRFGLIDKGGRAVWPFEYGAIEGWDGDGAVVETDEGRAYRSADGQWLVPPDRDLHWNLAARSEGMVPYSRKLLGGGSAIYGFVDARNGTVLAPRFFSFPGPVFDKGLCWVQPPGDPTTHQLIDRTGRVVRQFDEAGMGFALSGPLSCGLSRAFEQKIVTVGGARQVHRSGRQGFVNVQGQWRVGPLNVKDLGEAFHEGLVAYGMQLGEAGPNTTGVKRGFMDVEGRMVVPPIYDECKPFRAGRALVAKHGEGAGYIDPTGKVVIPLKWERADSFVGDYATVGDRDGYVTVIDKAGRIIVSTRIVYPPSF